MIRIYCKNNGVTKEVETGLTLREIYDAFGLEMPYGVIAARVNNVTEGLAKRLYRNKDVEFIDVTSNDGMRMYVRSLLFIFMKAMNESFPGETVRFENAISKGYYCRMERALRKGPYAAASAAKLSDIGANVRKALFVGIRTAHIGQYSPFGTVFCTLRFIRCSALSTDLRLLPISFAISS